SICGRAVWTIRPNAWSFLKYWLRTTFDTNAAIAQQPDYIPTSSASAHRDIAGLALPYFRQHQRHHAGLEFRADAVLHNDRLRVVDIAASGFDGLRAHSMNRVASGLNVRFFNVTTPTGRGGMGRSMGRALSPERFPLNLKSDPGRTDRKRPV